MGISDWSAAMRPREKLLLRGADALSDAELLAIFLRTGHSGRSAIQLAQQLLEHFQGIRGLLQADQASCCQIKGLGPAKYAQLQAVMELAKRCLDSELKRGQAITEPRHAARYLQAKLQALPYEAFLVVFLDNQHRVITSEELFRGTIDSAQVYPREVVRKTCQHNAAALLLAHNHPSGKAEASQADIDITRQLSQVLQGIDVRVLDHLIIAGEQILSLAEEGLM